MAGHCLPRTAEPCGSGAVHQRLALRLDGARCPSQVGVAWGPEAKRLQLLAADRVRCRVLLRAAEPLLPRALVEKAALAGIRARLAGPVPQLGPAEMLQLRAARPLLPAAELARLAPAAKRALTPARGRLAATPAAMPRTAVLAATTALLTWPWRLASTRTACAPASLVSATAT